MTNRTATNDIPAEDQVTTGEAISEHQARLSAQSEAVNELDRLIGDSAVAENVVFAIENNEVPGIQATY